MSGTFPPLQNDGLERTRILLAEAYQRETTSQTLLTPRQPALLDSQNVVQPSNSQSRNASEGVELDPAVADQQQHSSHTPASTVQPASSASWVGQQPASLESSSLGSGTAPPGPRNVSVSRQPNPRNLVVVLDGTANQFGVRNSNCVELYSHLEKNDLQKTYYNSGIGTYINPQTHGWLTGLWDKILNAWDLAFAFRLKRYVIGAYRWLSNQYIQGDKIFLFGFSRGAYEVRALAAMIQKVGLIHTGNEEQIEFAYDLYADSSKKGQELARVFKETFSREGVKIHFIGAWDTVSSVGIFNAKTLPGIEETLHVTQIRHAVALDERRVKFQPELYYSPTGKGEVTNPFSNVKEVWFPGSHSDVGGGSRDNPDLNLADVPLLWMEREAMHHDLQLRPVAARISDSRDIAKREVSDSMTWAWRLLELRHRCRGRAIPPLGKLHVSTLIKLSRHRPPPEGVSESPVTLQRYIPAAFSSTWPAWTQLEQPVNADFIEADQWARGDQAVERLIQCLKDDTVDATRLETSMVELIDKIGRYPETAALMLERGMLRFMLSHVNRWNPFSNLGKGATMILWDLIDTDSSEPSDQHILTQTFTWLESYDPAVQWIGILTLGKILVADCPAGNHRVVVPEVQATSARAIHMLIELFGSMNPAVADAALETAGCLVNYDAARLILREEGLVSALVRMTDDIRSRSNLCKPMIGALCSVAQYSDMEIGEADKVRIVGYLDAIHREGETVYRESASDLRRRFLNGAVLDPAWAESRLQAVRNRTLSGDT